MRHFVKNTLVFLSLTNAFQSDIEYAGKRVAEL